LIVAHPKPLVILTADKDAQFAIQTLIRRATALGIHPIDFDCIVHPMHDSGVFRRAHEILRGYLKWDYALAVFDKEGCGYDERPPNELESLVEQRMAANGWGSRARAVVIDPELESWLWDATYQVHRVLGWPEGAQGLSRWMADRQDGVKPVRPKESFDAALRYRRKPHSAALFAAFAKDCKFDHCQDRAFRRFSSILKSWFRSEMPIRTERSTM
jgi:hypothetical protein